ncbi:hypothetical protein P4O66_007877, partial [Electrophorus voltai]
MGLWRLTRTPRSLYETYLHHCQTVFQNAAQDTDDIVKVNTSGGVSGGDPVSVSRPQVLHQQCHAAPERLKLTAHDGS